MIIIIMIIIVIIIIIIITIIIIIIIIIIIRVPQVIAQKTCSPMTASVLRLQRQTHSRPIACNPSKNKDCRYQNYYYYYYNYNYGISFFLFFEKTWCKKQNQPQQRTADQVWRPVNEMMPVTQVHIVHCCVAQYHSN